jgi:hypothetical protein
MLIRIKALGGICALGISIPEMQSAVAASGGPEPQHAVGNL